MKLSEFREKAEASQRANIKFGFSAAGLLVVLPFAGMAFGLLVKVFLLHRPWNAPDSITVLAGAWVGLILGFFALFFLEKRMVSKKGIPCPSCEKDLGRHGGIVIASRHCPFCGVKAIED